MHSNRRQFLTSATAGLAVAPFLARAAGHGGEMIATPSGDLALHPISHASFVLQTPAGTLYVDPVGEPSAYADLPPADLVLITHEHGDHYNAQTLRGLVSDTTPLVANRGVHRLLPEDLMARTTEMANGDSIEAMNIGIEAIPAYNITDERLQFHPQGRDNGYVLTLGDFRVYVSGDTEDIPEMRALSGIDLAFVCMNLPFTMDVNAASDAVIEFAPGIVYPYHYRGRDGGTQDPAVFAELVGDASEVRLAAWYG